VECLGRQKKGKRKDGRRSPRKGPYKSEKKTAGDCLRSGGRNKVGVQRGEKSLREKKVPLPEKVPRQLGTGVEGRTNKKKKKKKNSQCFSQ